MAFVGSWFMVFVDSKAQEGEEPVPVPYRFDLSPARNGKCNVFSPNPLNADSVRSGHDCLLQNCFIENSTG